MPQQLDSVTPSEAAAAADAALVVDSSTPEAALSSGNAERSADDTKTEPPPQLADSQQVPTNDSSDSLTKAHEHLTDAAELAPADQPPAPAPAPALAPGPTASPAPAPPATEIQNAPSSSSAALLHSLVKPPPPAETAPAPTPAAEVPVAPARAMAVPRRSSSRPKPKGILKPPTVQQSRFSFKRDILTPFNARLSYTAYGVTQPPPQPSTSAPPHQAPLPPPGQSAAQTLKTAVTGGQAGLVQGTAAAAAAAGGFWGSALKKWSGVAAAVPLPASIAPVGQRDLAEDQQPLGSTSAAPDSPMPPSTGSPLLDGAPTSPAEHRRHPLLPPSLDGAAPHTPTRGTPTSTSVSSSPYATIRATLAPSSLTPAPPAPPPLSVGELKRVRFRMATLKIVYPINGPNGPLAPWQEGETRKRVNLEYRSARKEQQLLGGDSRGWTGESLARLYAECCRTREEPGIERVKRALRANPKSPPRVLDLSNELLSHGAIEALADLLSVDFGLKKLVLESCGLDDDSLKPLLHALLVSGSVPTLSLASNKRIKVKGWKLLAIFIRKARFLRYLDVSENNIDKKAAELIVQALAPGKKDEQTSPPLPPLPLPLLTEATTPQRKPSPETTPASSSPPAEVAASQSSLSDTTKAALGLSIEELESDDEREFEPLFTVAPLLKDESSDSGTVLSIRFENCGLKGQTLEALAHGVRASSLKHISLRRNKINAMGAVALAVMIRDYALTSNHSDRGGSSLSLDTLVQSNGILADSTTLLNELKPAPLTAVNGDFPAGIDPTAASAAAQAERDAWQNSEARNKLRRQIEELPRTGSLLTLDVKGNDLRNGVTYISQVLKRNRTLKVLNLSENKIDVAGLVSIADALKFNSTLETLDMSFNPCCGPSLEGITALRSAFTINSNLKRVFLNHTSLSSEGAIALAEFLPECNSLLHLDLTGNFEIDIAGVMALAVSLKMNTRLRCLDLDIPPNDPDFSRLSQDILQCCVRNTEDAQEEAEREPGGKRVAAPILKSAVALAFRQKEQEDEQRRLREEARKRERDALRTRVGLGPEQEEQILAAADECHTLLQELVQGEEQRRAAGGKKEPLGEIVRETLIGAQLAEAQLQEAVAAQATRRAAEGKTRAEVLADQLSALLDRAKEVFEGEEPSRPTLLVDPSALSPSLASAPSPNFSLADSDDSDEGEPEQAAAEGSALAVESDDELDSQPPPSPIGTQSRKFTEEEGEVFRKGTAVIGDVTEDDGGALEDASGEELRKEILETPVKRSPRTSFSGEGAEAGVVVE